MTITLQEHQRISNLHGALETTRAMLNVIESAFIEGAAFELHKQYAQGWIANYRVRMEGQKRWRNIGGKGSTAVEATQDARANLFNLAKTRKLMYGASEAIATIVAEGE